MQTSTWHGHAIVIHHGFWCFADTLERTDSLVTRACGFCGTCPTVDGHDACVGTLPGVQNACCGHGERRDAYVQFLDGGYISGQEAMDFFAGIEAKG